MPISTDINPRTGLPRRRRRLDATGQPIPGQPAPIPGGAPVPPGGAVPGQPRQSMARNLDDLLVGEASRNLTDLPDTNAAMDAEYERG